MRKVLKYIAFVAVCLIAINAFGQRAGETTYDFLTLTSSARVGALGGNQVGMAGSELGNIYHNPAALNASLHQSVALNFVPFVSGIKYGYAAYAHEVKGVGCLALGVHSINYGSFDRYDENDVALGTFTAAEYAFMLHYSRPLSPKWTAGMAFKPILSQFESYQSFGLAVDLGLLYQSTDSLTSFGFTVKNAGSQLSTYNREYEPLPFDIQLGFSRKLAHAPFRLSLTIQDLLDWKTEYEVYDGSGELIEDYGVSGNAFNALMRHAIVGVEFLPSKNFYIAFGYNHRRRLDLLYEEKLSMVGFSWGFGFRVNRFHIAYGSAGYHIAGSTNHISISTNINKFKRN